MPTVACDQRNCTSVAGHNKEVRLKPCCFVVVLGASRTPIIALLVSQEFEKRQEQAIRMILLINTVCFHIPLFLYNSILAAVRVRGILGFTTSPLPFSQERTGSSR